MKRLSVWLAVVCASACGGGTNAPSAPSTTTTSVTITTQGNMLFLGNSMTLEASATLSNGTTQAVTSSCSWGGDAPSVASVNASTGSVSGVGSGEVTVWCDYQGMRGTKRLRVIPNYAGVFFGSYAITGCSASGIFNGICSELTTGRVMPLRFDFQQTNDSLSGRTSLGSLTSDAFVASVRADGTVQVNSRYSGSDITIWQEWNLNQRQSARIEGNLTQRWENHIYVGDATITANLFNTNRQLNAMPTLAPAPTPPLSLNDLLRAIGR